MTDGPAADPRQVHPPHRGATSVERAARVGEDPLRLCVMATVALLGWLLGPVAVLVFAGVGAAGYVSARRAGLLRSRCKLGDTRLVIAYLVLLAAVAAVFAVRALAAVVSGGPHA
ncbi:hypothetical protein [Phycicoccus duodecadis]|uniref:Uncharacterized protein n=1 Tax=Phycicoccus duodecadis TaxID=173053 RepID=A0A2N3YEN7_9MICO|nr:hypothetical protein [Phycicoccus duodecadis]PKW25319.1 hypothetical protein ATL31_0107 [Phycicoccus duodecadis]